MCSSDLELPPQLIQGELPRNGGAALRREQRLDRLTRVDRPEARQIAAGGPGGQAANAVRRRSAGGRVWAVGDRLLHSAFGEGVVTHLFGSGEKVSIAVKFPGMGAKILDPRLAPIEPLHGDPR